MENDGSSYKCSNNDRICLILSHFWTPINVTTAKEAIRKLITCGSDSSPQKTVKALTRDSEPVVWEDWINSGRVSYHQNQPHLSSCSRLYPVPTILLTNSRWVYKTKSQPNIRYLFNRYKGQCQICGDFFKDIRDLSIEHIYPKSLGGTKDWHNVTLTCKKCNCLKGAKYPYKNHEGEELKPPNPFNIIHTHSFERPEWKTFLFKD